MSGNSKKKERRSRSNSNEANSSFVKNVTSRVTGLLPATIAKWFSSPSSTSNDAPKSNGSVLAGDATDSSTEDEAPENPATIQPPAKRMRLSPPAQYNHFSPNDTSVSDFHMLESITPYNNTQSSHRKEYNSNFLELHLPKSDSSQDEVEKSNNVYKPQHSISSASLGSGSRKRKSIFDTPSISETKIKTSENSSANTSRDLTMPTFKPCLLGSPFYSGRTMYGGAASSYINQPHIKQRKATVVNETPNKVNTISHSALRVMDLLEQYSSPVSEARRIPVISPNRSRENLLSRLESLAQPQSKSLSYKTQELHVPSIASILRLKQKSRLVNTTNVARQILASHSSTSDQPYVSIRNQKRVLPSEESTSQNYTTKIKSRLTRTRRGDVTEEITLEPVNLPAATLQIDQSKLLNFSFEIKPVSLLKESTKPTAPTVFQSTSNSTINTVPAVTSNNDITSYQFSIPIQVASPVNIVNNMPHPGFTFGRPERTDDQANQSSKIEQNSNAVVTQQKKTEEASSKSKDWQCGDCWVFNKLEVEKCVCCGGKKPSTNEAKLKCSICKVAEKQQNSDKCVDCDKTAIVNNRWPVNKESDSSKWKCYDCWVENYASAEKCLCCGAAKIKKTLPSPASEPSTSTISEEWKCEDCWIKNKKSDNKCAACGSSMPGAKQSQSTISNTTSVPVISDNTFKAVLKSQTDKWECPNCLVGNDKERTKCVCCDSEKPGSKKEPKKKTFNFDMKSNVTFKFGIDTKIQENNISKLDSNTPEINNLSKETKSEKNNNVLPKTPSFTFGSPTKKDDEQPKSSQVDVVPTMTFTFGVPQSLSSNSTPTPPSVPTFTFKNKLTEQAKTESNKIVEKEKPQEVPKIDFSSPITQAETTKKEEQKPPVLFSLPVHTSQPSQEKKTPSLFGTPQATEQKESTAITSVSTVATKPVTTFSFANSSAKPAPLFGSTAPPSLFAEDKPATTVQPLFQQPPPATSAGPPPVTNATLFSFGNTDEKPKFQFTFGGQPKSETPAPLFGSAKPDGPAPLFGITKSDSPAPLFGNTKTDAPASLFNSTKTDAQPSLFGNTKTEAPAPLFGTTKTDGPAPLFGNSNSEAPANLFGNTKPDTNLFTTPGKSDASLFGTSTKNDGPLFGSNTKTNSTLFGNTSKSETPLFSTPTKTDATLFGNTSKPEPPLFGNSVKTESPMFKFGGSSETSTGGNKFTGNLFGNTTNDTSGFGAQQPAAGLFAGQKPAAFSFGSTPVFGAASTTFGASEPAAAPMFGASNSTPSNNIFGATPASGAGSGLFGSASPVATPNFGAPNASIPPFEASSLTTAPAPAFNFGAPQNTAVFGFGQQQQAPQAAGAPVGGGVYTFGGGAGAAGSAGLQFTMGAGAGAAGAGGPVGPRRVRKVARRNLPR